MTDTEKKHDYKSTLNLPQTDFPMKANLPQREPEFLKKWDAMGLYQKMAAANKGKKKFVLLDGPPYANGHIHVGHAVNKTLKDIIVKAKLFSGFDAPYVPGWDCHGLPIEVNVEKKFGRPGQKISATQFRAECRAYAASQIDIQRDEFIRLGVLGDWQHPYCTMDFNYEANIIRSLAKIVHNKHLQKGYKPVHWCLDCASALAEAEVEYQDKTSPSIDVRFSVVDLSDFYQRVGTANNSTLPVSIPIWTTTPWTLPANQAVALHAELTYLLIEADGKERLLIAKPLLETVLKRYEVNEHKVVASVEGMTLEKLLLQHPFYDRHVPVVLGEHVTVEAGTGAVHTAPAHGVDDFAVGKKYQLTLDNPVGDDGCYTASTPLFAGLHVNKANEKILEVLIANQKLIHQEKMQHSFPHCWRHKTPLIFRATPQWFISMDAHGLRQMSLAGIQRVEWIPEWGQSRISNMIENRPDWCISRQRTWGVPLCLFIHKETGELHPQTEKLMETVAKRVEKEGIEAWYALDEKEILGADAAQYKKTMDVLDVWFDSGVLHSCLVSVHPELTYPSDLVIEGSDQHRGWFHSSLLTSMAMNGVEPYKEVLTHGFVVDGQGRKMSKSLGNVVAPEEVIKTLGADILRLWVASVDYRNEIAASNEILTRTSEIYRRIRNTARFLLANLNGFDPIAHSLPEHDMLALDRYMLDRAAHIQNEIMDAYHDYQFHVVVQKLHQFCVADLGGFYLDIIKDRQYTMQTNSIGRRSAQTALYHIAHAFVRWMAPILSFTAEEIWGFIPGEKSTDSVFLTEWYKELPLLPANFPMSVAFWDKVKEVRNAVNKEIETMRANNQLGSALEAEVSLYCAPELKAQLDLLASELRFVLITSAANVIADHAGPTDAVLTDVPGLTLKISATTCKKCDRCWHRMSDVNTFAEFPGLCGRCVENVAKQGEERRYA